MLVEQLAEDEAIATADTVLLTVPNQLGVDYNAHLLESVAARRRPRTGLALRPVGAPAISGLDRDHTEAVTASAAHGRREHTMATTGAHAADSHDLIRVQGARENNLKDVSVELPKRRLTVFTGVSGSGKSSLVFATIAAESQRMINETYSAFVQGFMPSLARPEVDFLEGLTTAIIVDQERMGANPRSTVGTATDANAMLRILFSRLGTPHVGPPTAYSFNVPTRKAERRDVAPRRAGAPRRRWSRTPSTSAACARAARAWATSATST